MISQLSAKYQFGTIHTLTQRILDANRALLYATGDTVPSWKRSLVRYKMYKLYVKNKFM